jgi:mRNA interferase HigB
MHVISTKKLRDYVAEGYADAATPLFAWAKVAKAAKWAKFADVRQTVSSADSVGNCVVFNIGGNNYRLIAGVRYPTGKVYVLKVMTHAEYDKRDWVEECGCHSTPPRRPKVATKRK